MDGLDPISCGGVEGTDMRTQLPWWALAMLMPFCLIAADAPTNAQLKTVAAALQPVLEKLEPRPEFAPSSSDTLLITYKAQVYKVHGRSMTGEIFPEVHDQLGPTFKGFVLGIHLQNLGEVNQAVTPQTLQEPYWKTDLDVTPLAGTQKQIFWALSYGTRTDAALLAELRQRLKALKDAPPADRVPNR
jgi:hypothetical protein